MTAAPGQVRDHLAQLRRFTRTRGPLDHLERRLLRALERDATGTAEPDGYPTTHGREVGRGGGVDVKLTPTEAAASARMRPRRNADDPVHHHATQAAELVELALVHLQAAAGHLDRIDMLSGVPEERPATCEWCTPHRRTAPPVDHHRSTVGDRLHDAADLCHACWRFVERTAPAGSHAGYLPTPRQIADHDDTGRWRIRREVPA